MMALVVAFRAFFAALFNSAASQRIQQALDSKPATSALPESSKASVEIKPQLPAKPEKPVRSEALTLLSTLQREARLVDLVCEPLDQFSDQQIGAAAREVLRDCKKTLDRMFAIQPLSEAEEGAKIDIPATHSPAKLRLVGASSGQRGTIVHRGWKATVCELPSWQGDKSDAMTLAPTEVEVG